MYKVSEIFSRSIHLETSELCGYYIWKELLKIALWQTIIWVCNGSPSEYMRA